MRSRAAPSAPDDADGAALLGGGTGPGQEEDNDGDEDGDARMDWRALTAEAAARHSLDDERAARRSQGAPARGVCAQARPPQPQPSVHNPFDATASPYLAAPSNWNGCGQPPMGYSAPHGHSALKLCGLIKAK